MRGIACAVAILCAQLGLGASAIAASPPDPAHSSLQGAFIDIAGTDPTGAPDPCNVSGSHCANYSMVIRDFANNPVPGAPVLLDLSNCPDIQLSTTQVGPSESQIVLCPGQVQATTDQFGEAHPRDRGSGFAEHDARHLFAHLCRGRRGMRSALRERRDDRIGAVRLGIRPRRHQRSGAGGESSGRVDRGTRGGPGAHRRTAVCTDGRQSHGQPQRGGCGKGGHDGGGAPRGPRVEQHGAVLPLAMRVRFDDSARRRRAAVLITRS